MSEVIFTIGQGKKNIEKFLNILSKHKIDLLIDIRSNPYSKISSFSQKELSNFLRKNKIKYLYLGNELGGENIKDVFRKNKGTLFDIFNKESFRKGLKTLWKLKKYYKICLFCAEEDPLECHRFLCIGAILKLKGNIDIVNILTDRKENFDFSTKRLIKELKLDRMYSEIGIEEIAKAFWYKLHFIYLNRYKSKKNDFIHYRLF